MFSVCLKETSCFQEYFIEKKVVANLVCYGVLK